MYFYLEYFIIRSLLLLEIFFYSLKCKKQCGLQMLQNKRTYQLTRIRIILEISKDIFASRKSISNDKKVVSFHAGNVMNIDYDNKLNFDTFIKF